MDITEMIKRREAGTTFSELAKMEGKHPSTLWRYWQKNYDLLPGHEQRKIDRLRRKREEKQKTMGNILYLL